MKLHVVVVVDGACCRNCELEKKKRVEEKCRVDLHVSIFLLRSSKKIGELEWTPSDQRAHVRAQVDCMPCALEATKAMHHVAM